MRTHTKPLLFALMMFAFAFSGCKKTSHEDEFIRLTNVGKNYCEKGQGEKAVPPLQQALALDPGSANAHLNLANAYLLSNQAENALKQAQEALALEHGTAAGLYLEGCAYLRLGNAKEAVKSLQQAKEADRTINAVSFQLGRAYQQLGNFDAASEQFSEVIQYEPDHVAAHWNLSQVLDRLNKPNEAAEQRTEHQKLLAAKPNRNADISAFERSAYTQIRVPFRLEQPDPKGVPVSFADITDATFGPEARTFSGPACVIDPMHDGRQCIVALQSNSWNLLSRGTNGTYQRSERTVPAREGNVWTQCLVGDLNNDRSEEVLALGTKGAQVIKISTNRVMTDASMATRLGKVEASGGLLADVGYKGKLDLLAISPTNQTLEYFRNLGFYFVESSTNLEPSRPLAGVTRMMVDDWNDDGVVDLFLGQSGKPPLLLARARGGPLTATNSPSDWPAGDVFAVGDLNNDLKSDLLVVSGNQMVGVLNNLAERLAIPLGNWNVRNLYLLDYDNDGWLDIVAVGDGVRVWRNRGKAGFLEVTQVLGLDKSVHGKVVELAAADFDQDGDTDWLLTLGDGQLQMLRNDGGNSNLQIKLQLLGTKSNTSGLGMRVEVNAGGLRLSRRVSTLPVEIGVGKNQQVDSLTVQWFDFPMTTVDVKVEPKVQLELVELEQQGGSCPYFYAWDGEKFRFVSDFLSASPAGLPLMEGRYIDADADEFVWVGNEQNFRPKDGSYQLQITEELREVLYLDQAALAVVDHPAGTEAFSTSKLRPGKPFALHQVITVHKRSNLIKATREDGSDVTELLREIDGNFVAPRSLRNSQLRGLAEPHSYILNFGEIDTSRPLVLALTGWLRFGGATINVAAGENPELPFPFPTLEAETASGTWEKVEVSVGAPAGKIKTIVVDLTGKLPTGTKRLRLTEAFELYWDRIALLEKREGQDTEVFSMMPTKTDLHWRGFSSYSEMPNLPLFLPDYKKTMQNPPWPITPSGWCTKYGPVDDLIHAKDNAVALINGGDELTLSFASEELPAKKPGIVRDFFLFAVGWDKDSDFHVAAGTVVDPIPWHGMDSQQYGHQPRPAFPSDSLMEKRNTRWVGPYTLRRVQK